MKSGRKGFPCTPRNTGSKMSQSCASSSEMSSKVCGCGERLLILKASTVQNKGRLFWRCRNWAVSFKSPDFYWMLLLYLWYGFIFFFRRPIHIVITLNGLMTRNLIFKGKKLKVKPVVEKELMVGKKVKKMKFLWKGRKLCWIWWRKMRSWRWNCNKRKKLGHSCFFYLWYCGSQQL